MRRSTHHLMGAAVALPVAFTLEPAAALAAMAFGVVGGALPDYIDLRSGARYVLRHRGVSHSIFLAAGLSAGMALFLRWLATIGIVPDQLWRPWSVAFALGLLSHLVGDACTVSGIQPFLPLARRKIWLLPRGMRGRSSGPVDRVVWLAMLLVLVGGIALYASTRPITWGFHA